MGSEDPEFGHITEPATCEVHGDYLCKVAMIMGRRFRQGCPECNKIANEKKEEEDKRAELFKAKYELSLKLGSALIPKRFQGKTFETYIAESDQQKAALAKCMDYAENFASHKRAGRCMLLLGKPGTGKTHLAIAIANQIMVESSHTAVYRTLGGVLQDIRESYDDNSPTNEGWILKGLIAPSLLVLDEIGASKEKPSEFELTTLFSIINGRYERELPTVIVSNLGPKELAASIGERSADRLREGGVIVLPFTWESQRGKEGF
ncbi:helicase loader [Pseudomonas phage AH02]|nr:helicase loader [Pseudomonas phage AH02]